MKRSEVKEFLDQKVVQYNTPSFITDDPISIPARFQKKEDIEIAGFLTSIIAWGQRKTIIKNAEDLLSRMDGSPHEFLMELDTEKSERFDGFVHRTFNAVDCRFFIERLSALYRLHGGLESTLGQRVASLGPERGISAFKSFFFNAPHEARSQKHLADPLKGSSAKRINMFLRWMVRKDDQGVDFGLWDGVDPSNLSLPLDVHTGNVGRSLKILRRKQNDWRAVAEIDMVLRQFDSKDPVKYDFALFGLGVHEGFSR